MQHVGRVDVLEAPQDLVQEVADVVVAQPLGLEQLVKVRLHQGLHDVAGGGECVKDGHGLTTSEAVPSETRGFGSGRNSARQPHAYTAWCVGQFCFSVSLLRHFPWRKAEG